MMNDFFSDSDDRCGDGCLYTQQNTVDSSICFQYWTLLFLHFLSCFFFALFLWNLFFVATFCHHYDQAQRIRLCYLRWSFTKRLLSKFNHNCGGMTMMMMITMMTMMLIVVMTMMCHPWFTWEDDGDDDCCFDELWYGVSVRPQLIMMSTNCTKENHIAIIFRWAT